MSAKLQGATRYWRGTSNTLFEGGTYDYVPQFDNDNLRRNPGARPGDVFRARPKINPGFGRAPARRIPVRIPGLGRIVPMFGAALLASELYDMFNAQPYRVPGGWVLRRDCRIGATHQDGHGTAIVLNCITGQNLSPDALGSPIPNSWDTLRLWWRQSNGRYSLSKVYTRNSVQVDSPYNTVVDPGFVAKPKTMAVNPFARPNPNVMRNSWSEPMPWVDPFEAPVYEAPKPEPTFEPDTYMGQDGALFVPRAVEVSSDGFVDVPTTPKEPPRRGEHERKVFSRSAKAGIAIFRALDVISESAEVVDSFYQALPEKIRKRWGCDKINRGLIDSAGQYGIDSADCKGRALYHNWRSVDLDEAFKNLIKNAIEDAVIGRIQQRLPKQFGNADLGNGNKAVSQLIDDLASGLESFYQ